MSGKIRNPEKRCRICGGKCEKRMRYCRACAREVKEIRERREGVYFTPPSINMFLKEAALDIQPAEQPIDLGAPSLNVILANPPLAFSSAELLGEGKHLSAPRRGAQERKPPRQETGPSPANLEGTR